ncbi:MULTISPECIES: MipA/OmpV family protein [unclassified Yoonia]|uniref:MipA/OmpV family protein n=1 Tax=unclassified Yoonia TaxID=2629118 RepID=UPI002AFF8B35|nr:MULTISPECIES: MipA/OmpV family protein [unclassified Yoonia]
MRGLIILVLGFPSAGLAQATDDRSVVIGLGAQSAPAYFGADSNETGVTGRLTFGETSVGKVALGDSGLYSLGFGGSLRFIGARAAADHAELAGLADIDATLELGGAVTFFAPQFEAFTAVRYGFGGHEALVAEVGGDLVYRPGDRWTVRGGPRLLWGSDDYAQTYFGVSAAEAVTSSFGAYDAGAGIISTGIAAEVSYQVTADWGVLGILRYDQLQGDAAGSPIVQSKDQTSVSLMVTRRVSFGF